MGVDVNRGNVMTTTESLRKNALCHKCLKKFSFVERGHDGKWYCIECLGISNPLVVPAPVQDGAS